MPLTPTQKDTRMSNLKNVVSIIRDLSYEAYSEAANYNEWSRDDNDPPPEAALEINEIRNRLDEIVVECYRLLNQIEINKDDLVKFIEQGKEAAE